MLAAGDSWIPEAPSLGDIFDHTLSGPIRWLFGSNGGAIIAGVVLTALAVKTWVDLVKEGKGILRAGKEVLRKAIRAGQDTLRHAAAARRRFVGRLRERSAVQKAGDITWVVLVIVFKVAVVGLVVAGQLLWLQVTVWFLPTMDVLWNVVTWGSWELHGDGGEVAAEYHAWVGGALLLVTWLVLLVRRDPDVSIPTGLALGAVSVLLPALVICVLLIPLVLGTALNLLYALGSVVFGGTNQLGEIGEVWLYFLGAFAYLAGAFAAMWAPVLALLAWRTEAA